MQKTSFKLQSRKLLFAGAVQKTILLPMFTAAVQKLMFTVAAQKLMFTAAVQKTSTVFTDAKL
jgi:hypothetical protein